MTASTSSAQVILGLSPLVMSLTVFISAYGIIISERINRSITALLGACLMVLFGVLTQDEAFSGIDLNTIGLLIGMMIIVGITQKTGVFQYVAIVSAKLVKADPWKVLVVLAMVTAIFSALLDNVTTVLLITPVALLIADALAVSAYPYLFSTIIASNIGGTATLIGDPPNIMIGSAANLSFNQFIVNLTPIVAIIMLVSFFPIWLLWGRQMRATAENKAQLMAFDERKAILDYKLLKQSLAVVGLVIFGFIVSHALGLPPATIAMFGAALLLLLYSYDKEGEERTQDIHRVYGEVEWITIMFFVGLFIMVTAINKAGALDILAAWIVEVTHGDYAMTAATILWGSAVLSAVVDNIPFVATMIPVIHDMGNIFGPDRLEPLWWSLSLGACLGGNGTLVGASANLVVAGLSERGGQPIRFMTFTLVAFPLMVGSVAISHFYIWLRYL